MAGEPGDFDRAPAPEWPSGPVYGQVPPPPPAAEPDSGPSREAWFLALGFFVAALVVMASRRHGYESGYALGRVAATGAISLLIATLVRRVYLTVSGSAGDAWHPWALVLAGVAAVLLAATTWPDQRDGSSAESSLAAFANEAQACRSSTPSPLVTGGMLSFRPVDDGTSQAFDTMLTRAEPTMESLVEVRAVDDGDLTPAVAFAAPGFSDSTVRSGFVSGLENSVEQAGGSFQSVAASTGTVTLLQAGQRYVASGFAGCYAVTVAAPSESAALRLEEEILQLQAARL